MRLLIRLALSALAFTTIFPLIPGINFHGNFWIGMLMSLMFVILLWGIELLSMGIAAIWTIGSFGLALLWLIPLWIFGFWILPAGALMITAELMPQHLTIGGFIPAAIAGLVLLFIGICTSKNIWPDKKDN